MRQLPETFVERMRAQLGPEFDAFLASFGEPRAAGLRLNTLKTSPDGEAAQRILAEFQCEPVPWCREGFYYPEQLRPGKHPYHAAGLYYIQEPSAMSAVEELAPEPGDIVLDLAAAPGGKATQIAARLRGEGLLIANEIHPARAKALSENMERWGAAHAVVTQCPPDRLSETFAGFFDKIMVDAPCSGEGMFRKDPQAVQEWSPENVRMCAARQADILDHAVRMLKPGGRLAYSTCTFNEEENERVIEAFLDRHPDMECRSVRRIWPHRERGEGHFVAVLAKSAGEGRGVSAGRGGRAGKLAGRGRKECGQAMELFRRFAGAALPDLRLPDGEPLLFGEQLYWLPAYDGTSLAPFLEGLKTPRPGLHLGTCRKQRFEPAHALALFSGCVHREGAVRLAPDDPRVEAYLRGEELELDEGDGWKLLTVDGYPLGWVKLSGGKAKNHFPKGLRRPY
jgi:NOL1/NOP2/sun family putative RNA methylase